MTRLPMVDAADGSHADEDSGINPESMPNDVRLDGVCKLFGTVWALKPTSLGIARGEFFSLLGASGSGKTTTLRIIAGFEQPTSGRVFLRERDVTWSAPYERNVNTVFQDELLDIRPGAETGRCRDPLQSGKHQNGSAFGSQASPGATHHRHQVLQLDPVLAISS
jgi:spermidine/putrescine transport system ATP-binding protein